MSKCTRPEFCSTCPINLHTEGYVPPVRVNSQKLLVGEAAGENEARESRPFVGQAGSYLNSMLARAGEKRSQYNIINVIGCRPRDNVFPLSPEWSHTSRDEAVAAVEHCATHHFRPFVKATQWDKVLALGEQALKATTGRTGISYWRGSPLPLRRDLTSTPDRPVVMPTYHPSYVGRMSQYCGLVINDMQKPLTPRGVTLHVNDHTLFTKHQPQRFAFDLEWDQHENITLVGVSSNPTEAWVYEWNVTNQTALKQLFENATDLIGWNIVSADLPHFERLNWRIKATLHDTMLKQHLIQPDFPHTLAFAASVFTNAPFWKGRSATEDDESAQDVSGAPQYRTWGEPWALSTRYGGYRECKNEHEAWMLYNAYDTARSFEIEQAVDSRLRELKLDSVYWNVSLPVALVCRDITRNGWLIDHARFEEIQQQLDARIRELDSELPEGLRSHYVTKLTQQPAPPGTYKSKTKKCRKCGNTITFEKPGALACECGLLVDSGPMNEMKRVKVPVRELVIPWRKTQTIQAYAAARGLNPGKNPKTQRDTVDKNVRKSWGAVHPEFIVLNELTENDTLRKTFVKDSLRSIDRMQFKILVHGTAEGRVSSSGKRRGIDLNIQNQPKAIRKLYIPDSPDHGILNTDFVSGENMLTAWFAEDFERLDRMMNDPNYDEHAELASSITGLDCSKNGPNAKYRKVGKIVNHGLNYGMGARKIMMQLHNAGFPDVSLKDAEDFVHVWRKLNPKTYQWQTRVANEVERSGVLVNPFGRKRWFTSRDWYGKCLAFLPASTLADITLRCMIALYPNRFAVQLNRENVRVARELPDSWRLRAQVHDSLITIGNDSNAQLAADTVRDVMTQPWAALNNFALRVEHEYSGKGGSWGDCRTGLLKD